MEVLELIVVAFRVARLPEIVGFFAGLTQGQQVLLGIVLVMSWAESLKQKKAKKEKK